MDILIKFPSRSRPEKFHKALNELKRLASDVSRLRFEFTIDDDELEKYNVFSYGGKSKNKIDAVNRNTPRFGWDVLVVMSDDMWCVQHGWDDIIEHHMNANFPDGDGFLHYSDGNQAANVCTMTIIGYKYWKRTEYIYNPQYLSVECDVEETERAYILGKHKYFEQILFRHLHPAWGLAETDEQYKKTEHPLMYQYDKNTILYRRKDWYGIPESERINGYYYNTL
jgi:hypothetical protein